MTISRTYNFTDLTVRDGAKIDTEFNILYNFLSGVSSNNLYIVFNDPSAAPLIVGQTSSNPAIEFQKNQVTKVYVSSKGSLASTLSTGTSPFIIVSTTKCPNLNVGYLDGIVTTAFNSNSLAGQFFKGDIQITKKSTGTQSIKFTQDSDTFNIKRTSDNASLFSVEYLKLDEGIILTLPSTTNLKVDYIPEETDFFDVIRFKELKYSDDKNIITSSVGGTISTGTTLLFYVCPCPLDGIIKLKEISVYVHLSATTHTIKVYKNGSDIGTINTNALATMFSKTFDESLNENDLILVKLTVGGGSTAISVQARFTW